MIEENVHSKTKITFKLLDALGIRFPKTSISPAIPVPTCQPTPTPTLSAKHTLLKTTTPDQKQTYPFKFAAPPGGLNGVGTKIDPTSTRAERLLGGLLVRYTKKNKSFRQENQARIHGLESPLHARQKIVWWILFTSFVMYYVFCLPFLEDLPYSIALYAHSGLMIVLLFSWLRVSLSNPGCSKTTDIQMTEINTRRRYPSCNACKIPTSVGRKHCWTCHKCVDGFDHHCPYLNTCIAKHNYWSFFITITSVTLIFALQSVVIFYLLCYQSHNLAGKPQYKTINPHTSLVHKVILVISAIIPTFAGLPMLVLVVFHIGLTCAKTTTRDFVLMYNHWRDARKRARQQKQTAADRVTRNQKQKKNAADKIALAQAMNKDLKRRAENGPSRRYLEIIEDKVNQQTSF